ncbi:MAG: twin-arginine translocase subunit TatC [Deltaproteobacteria bacterium]|nr:twin-arginine translocase subunit TatC [Deltaproteobacteria bacterium]
MKEQTDEKMPLVSHLEELRARLMRIAIVLIVGFVLCYQWSEKLFETMARPLIEALPGGSTMIFTSPTEAFFIYMKVAFFAAIFITSPYWLFQIWRFTSPGLYKSEKKHVLPFIVVSSMLFITGVLFAYFVVFPMAFRFLLSYASDLIRPMISIREYLSLVLRFMLAFGVIFELPVFMYFLAKIGVVNAAFLVSKRRYAILIIFIVAAVLTPGPDVVSQILMAIPLLILYEISIVVVRFTAKKKASAPAEDEEAAEEIDEKE